MIGPCLFLRLRLKFFHVPAMVFNNFWSCRLRFGFINLFSFSLREWSACSLRRNGSRYLATRLVRHLFDTSILAIRVFDRFRIALSRVLSSNKRCRSYKSLDIMRGIGNRELNIRNEDEVKVRKIALSASVLYIIPNI